MGGLNYDRRRRSKKWRKERERERDGGFNEKCLSLSLL